MDSIMKKNFAFEADTLIVTACCLIMLVFSTQQTKAQYFVEEFENINNLWSAGWDSLNNGSVYGTTTWFQGDTTEFHAYSGSGSQSYIAADFHNILGTGTISTWLIAPQRTFNNGDIIYFYTRKTDSIPPPDTNYPDRMEV